MTVSPLLAERAGLLIQIGDDTSRQPNFTNLVGDLGHDHQRLPWPLENDSVLSLAVTSGIEHVDPAAFIDWMNEAWRVCKVNGQLAIVTPYAGSPTWWADPLSRNGLTESTPWFFDPKHSSGVWRRYRPLPWRQERVSWHRQGNLEIIMRKRSSSWESE